MGVSPQDGVLRNHVAESGGNGKLPAGEIERAAARGQGLSMRNDPLQALLAERIAEGLDVRSPFIDLTDLTTEDEDSTFKLAVALFAVCERMSYEEPAEPAAVQETSLNGRMGTKARSGAKGREFTGLQFAETYLRWRVQIVNLATDAQEQVPAFIGGNIDPATCPSVAEHLAVFFESLSSRERAIAKVFFSSVGASDDTVTLLRQGPSEHKVMSNLRQAEAIVQRFARADYALKHLIVPPLLPEPHQNDHYEALGVELLRAKIEEGARIAKKTGGRKPQAADHGESRVPFASTSLLAILGDEPDFWSEFLHSENPVVAQLRDEIIAGEGRIIPELLRDKSRASYLDFLQRSFAADDNRLLLNHNVLTAMGVTGIPANGTLTADKSDEIFEVARALGVWDPRVSSAGFN